MAKKFEIRNSTAEFLTFVAEGKEQGVQVLLLPIGIVSMLLVKGYLPYPCFLRGLHSRLAIIAQRYAQDSSSSSLSRPQPEVAPPPPPPDWAAMVVAASMYSAKRRMAVFCTSPILARMSCHKIHIFLLVSYSLILLCSTYFEYSPIGVNGSESLTTFVNPVHDMTK